MGRRAGLSLAPALSRGDLVAVAAPGSAFDRAAFRSGAELLAARGYRVTYRADITARSGRYAGTDDRRAAELAQWLRDPQVRAVLFARGGYGTSRIVERVDLAALRRRPKILAGFSDLTVLLLAVARRAGLATVHGPMLAGAGSDRTGARDLSRLLDLLEGRPGALRHGGLRTLRPGRATAPVTGGNLSILAHSIGTPFEVETRGRILFVEEVGEPPYRVDRMVRQLALAGKLETLAGLVLGRFSGLRAGERREVERSFLDALGRLRIPVAAGLPAGHGGPNRALPLGVPAALDATAGTISFSPAVRAR